MTRLSSLLLALLLTVTPTVDVVCRAVCTAQLMGAAANPCHEVASPNVDGVLLPAVALSARCGRSRCPSRWSADPLWRQLPW